MSSLALLMQNYSDSEDDRSSDEESNRKRIKKSNNDDKINEDDLKKINLNKKEDDKEDEDDKIDELNDCSPELNKLISEKRIEEKNNHKLKYQDYLDDDFYTVNSNEIDDKEFEEDEELNTIDPSIIEFDNNEEKSNNDNINEKLESIRYSPKSFHRNLIGIDEEKIRIPEAPKDKECSQELIDIINDLHSKMRNGKNWIETISQKKSFRNPSIYEKLIAFCGIDEFGTNLPIEVYDIEKFRKKETNEHHEEHE